MNKRIIALPWILLCTVAEEQFPVFQFVSVASCAVTGLH